MSAESSRTRFYTNYKKDKGLRGRDRKEQIIQNGMGSRNDGLFSSSEKNMSKKAIKEVKRNRSTNM